MIGIVFVETDVHILHPQIPVVPEDINLYAVPSCRRERYAALADGQREKGAIWRNQMVST